MNALSIIILAAGLGSRMKSNLPKPLHNIGGKPMLEHVLNSARKLSPTKLMVIYGHKGEMLKAAFSDEEDITWVEQKTFEGTGDAVKYALPYCDPHSNVLILYGDTPLINHETLAQLVAKTSATSEITWLTSIIHTPKGYGRILRNQKGLMEAIIEEKDASEAQKALCEINTGIFAIPYTQLKMILPKITNNNQQQEYYLTDIAHLAIQNGSQIHTIHEDPTLILGVNDRQQLAELERLYQQSSANRLMQNGITLDKPETLTIRGHVSNGFDCHIEANVILEGNIVLGENVTIKTGCVLNHVIIGDNSVIHPYTLIEKTTIGKNASIGPFARIREKTHLGDNTRIGNFVETKKSTFGEGSKANHLSYVGDAIVGEKVNIGAGVITCNYDGANKHQTIIHDHAFIGSNSSLVAPVIIHENVTIAAGSTITEDINANELALTRAPLTCVKGWKRPTKKS